MTLTLHSQSADWGGTTGQSKLPNYAVNDLLVIVYAVSGETSLSIDDGTWTELFNDATGTTAYTSAGGTGDHLWTLADAAFAVWWKIADDANTGGDIDGPTLTTPSGDGRSGGVTYAWRQGAGLWNDPPIMLGDLATCDANDIGLAGYDADGHNTLSIGPLDAGFPSTEHRYVWALAVHSSAGIGAFHYTPPTFNMDNFSSTSANPIIDEGAGVNTTEGINLQTWMAYPDTSGRLFDPNDFHVGIANVNPAGDFSGSYVLAPAGARLFVVLDGPAPPANCFTLIGSRDDAAPTSTDSLQSALPAGYATGDAVLAVVATKFRDGNSGSYDVAWTNDAGLGAAGTNGTVRTGTGAGDIDVQVFTKILDGTEPTQFGSVVISWSNAQIPGGGGDEVDVFVVTRVYRGPALRGPAVDWNDLGGDVNGPQFFGLLTSVDDSLVTAVMAPALVGAQGAAFGVPNVIDWGTNLFVGPGYSTYETVVGDGTYGRVGPQTQLPMALLTADAVTSAGDFGWDGTLDWDGRLMRGLSVTIEWLECVEGAAYWGILATPQ